ncbi:DUF29 domain-containing protein [Caenispirillum bisanense]|uniref:DUF29 domain-containing protein n=1 Tax=Caenispirillum bisanense TaxID=414052 RepID=UPI0031DB8C76
MSKSALYDQDFYAWANEQAALLRAGKLAAADIEHIAEEIESMGKAEKRELVNRLTVLLLHLLKWQFQPVRRSNSWRATIRVQRLELARHLRDNPSLKPKVPEAIADAHVTAVIQAADETGLPESAFPATCPWSFEQVMDAEFWPDHS